MSRRPTANSGRYPQHQRSTSTMSRSITMEYLPSHAPPPTPPGLEPMPCQVRDKAGQFHVVSDSAMWRSHSPTYFELQPHVGCDSMLSADDKSSAEVVQSSGQSRSERFSSRLRKWLTLRGRSPVGVSP
ncbi:uncharacterized protein BROUX77_001991 [Berkeleyomyces rouxiae]|uniref:uncharacterized protein n=1 Tax=Berkeleyomyces rouxiae TaxID=2035830 RepID=UPI003B81C15D